MTEKHKGDRRGGPQRVGLGMALAFWIAQQMLSIFSVDALAVFGA
jgi:hypothetical protein